MTTKKEISNIQRRLEMLKWEKDLLDHEDSAGHLPWCDYCEYQQMETYCSENEKTRRTQCLCAKAYEKKEEAERCPI